MTAARGKVLVLGRDSRAFLAVVRSLGRGGLEVHATGPGIDSAPLRSRYLHRVHDLPPYRERDSTWLAAFAGLLAREGFDLVIPCTDTTLAALHIHRRELEPHGRLAVLDDRTYELLTDKGLSTAAARAAGVPVPREVVVADGGAPPPPFGWPLVLKPRTSYNHTNPSSRQEVRKVYREEDYARMLAEQLRGGPVLVQENVPGRGVGVELLLHRGEPLLTFQHVRVHEPLRGGGSSYRKSVPVSSDLLAASLALLRPLAYTGVAMVEFKLDSPSGRFFFMEVNPRFWGSLPLALAAGVDFPLALYRLLVEGRAPSPQRYRAPLFARNLTLDLEWQWANLRADHSDPTLATRPPRLVLRDAFANIVMLRERVDTFSLDDPAPAIEEVTADSGPPRIATAQGRGPALLCRPFVRRWQTRRAVRATRRARSVLFVCKGNVCRSPFAAALARHTGRFERVGSAGYYPVDKSPVAGECHPGRARLRGRSGDPSLATSDLGRRTRAPTRSSCSTARTTNASPTEFPPARRRVHFLSVLNPTGPAFIEDPWSGDLDRFRQVYAQIKAAVDTLAGGSRPLGADHPPPSGPRPLRSGGGTRPGPPRRRGPPRIGTSVRLFEPWARRRKGLLIRAAAAVKTLDASEGGFDLIEEAVRRSLGMGSSDRARVSPGLPRRKARASTRDDRGRDDPAQGVEDDVRPRARR